MFQNFLKKFTQYIKLFSVIHAATNPVIANDRKEMSVQATAPLINDTSWED